MKDELVKYDVALLSKEKGFDIPTYTSYIGGSFFESEPEPNGYDGFDLKSSQNWNKKDWVFSKDGGSCFGCKLDNIKYFEACSVPTQSLLQRWLREVHGIEIQNCIIGVYMDKTTNPHSNYTPSKMNDKGDTFKKYHFYINGISFLDIKGYDSYEEGLEEALLQSLNMIK